MDEQKRSGAWLGWPLALVLMLVLSVGCTRRSAEPQQQTSTLTIYGYTFILEHPEGTELRQEGKRTDDGQGHIDEDIKITCGQQALRIVNGKVTLNGEDRGQSSRATTSSSPQPARSG
jgi:hypothetical protein